MNLHKITKEDYYYLLIELRRQLLSMDGLLSVIVYGSLSRQELIPGKSDIDVLAILKGEELDIKLATFLNKVVFELFERFSIKIHLRIRNLYDLQQKASGLYDCGFSSSINKLRDSILLFGTSLDEYYLQHIRNATTEEIEQNIRLRFSDIKYQSRSLLSLISNQDDINRYNKEVIYKSGCIASQLAELVCYANGQFFLNAKMALEKAYKLEPNSIFKQALLLKRDETNLYLGKFVAEVDQIIYKTLLHLKPNLLERLKVVYLSPIQLWKESESQETTIWTILCKKNSEGDEGMVFKTSHLAQDGSLNICRYHLLPYNN